ncbi:MAG: patatin-like phospholipase family protein [Candidatus Krumholzibacteria bacterium]|nr:patatin-like phospholipase family protein [Candidatus Krumholzibacteria bacterium]
MIARKGFTRPFSCLPLMIAVLLAFSGALRASSAPGGEERPRIGLALSGGGARGAAHIGVLKVLEKYNVPIDYIAGTSMGALVGGLYASGWSPAELERLISEIDWTDSFLDVIPRSDRSFRRKRDDDLYLVRHKPGITSDGLRFPRGILDGQKIDLLLRRLTLPVVAIRDFDDLRIPFRAVAADLETGGAVVLGEGDLALALRASMSLPAVFVPREVDGRPLIDGGVSVNLPVDVVRSMGADIVIAVDISTPMAGLEDIKSVLNVVDQLSSFLTQRNTTLQIASLGAGDVFIRPDLGDIATGSFGRAVEAIPAGVKAAEAAAGRLSELAIPHDEYAARLAGRNARTELPVIDGVRVRNDSRISDEVIRARLEMDEGARLDVDRLEENLERIYGLELFESVYYDVREEAERTVLHVDVRERSWGADYIQMGVSVFEDFEGPNFNISLAYQATAINRLSGEFRAGAQGGSEPALFASFYQPLDARLRYFVEIEGSAVERADNIFDADGNKLSELQLRCFGGRLSAGRELGAWGEIRAGLIRERRNIKVQVGDPDAPDADFDRGEAFLRFTIDELDDVNFPSRGGFLRLTAAAGVEELGSDATYEQGISEGAIAGTFSGNTCLLRGYFASTRHNDSPFQAMFTLGGFTRLSGLQMYELNGQHAALLSGIFYRKLGLVDILPLYAGFSAEYGGVFERRGEIRPDAGIAAGSLFLGAGTVLGPIYLGIGFAEGDRHNFYFCLGQLLNDRRPGLRER